MTKPPIEPRLATLGIHGGEEDRVEETGAPVTPVLVRSATFLSGTTADDVPIYTRLGNNPTQELVAARIAALEGAEAALVLSSGMGAIAMALIAHVGAGDHVVASRFLYGATQALLLRDFPRRGVGVTLVDPDEGEDAWRRALRPETRVLYLELPTNPTLRVFDPAVPGRVAAEHGLELVVDSTFASPAALRVLEHGATLSVQSATKYLGGHSDLIAGSVAGAADRIARVNGVMRLYGPSPDPETCLLLERGMRTLALRMERHSSNALLLARWFAGLPEVERVHYPGLPDHPDRELIARLLALPGGMLSIVLRGGGAAADAFCRALRMARVAPSLGGVETLVSMPRFTSHSTISAEERAQAGIPDGMVRISVGIEDPEDLMRDFGLGIEAARSVRTGG